MNASLIILEIAVVVLGLALFLAGPEQRTLPVQMFNGVREEINPIIAAAATLLILLAVALLALVEFLRRRSARLAGKPR